MVFQGDTTHRSLLFFGRNLSGVDIQEKLAAGKGPAYERWAKVYNLKQMASALIFLQEKGIDQYAELDKLSESLVDNYHAMKCLMLAFVFRREKFTDAPIQRETFFG